MTFPNGITTTYRYDVAGRLANLTHIGRWWTLAVYTYTLDATGNRLAVTEYVLPPTPFNYLPVVIKDEGGEGMMAGEDSLSLPEPFRSPLPNLAPQPFTSPLSQTLSGGALTARNGWQWSGLLAILTALLVAVLLLDQKKKRRWSRPAATGLLAAMLALLGVGMTSGSPHPATSRPTPFLSPQTPPQQEGCVYPIAITGTQVISYTYDPLGRLKGAAYSSGECFRYGYDRVGNRTAQTQTITSTVATTYTYDIANRLTKVGGVTYTWDNNGNLTNDGSKVYTYTQANRLITVTATGLTWSAAYNGDGVRTRQTFSGAVNRYVQDLAAPLPVVLSDTNAIYVYGLGDSPLTVYSGTTWTYLSGRDGLLRSERRRDDKSAPKKKARLFAWPHVPTDHTHHPETRAKTRRSDSWSAAASQPFTESAAAASALESSARPSPECLNALRSSSNGWPITSSRSMRPSFITSTRCVRRAMLMSCVTTKIVMPCWLCRSSSRPITSSPLWLSRLPVGSSANKMAGWFASARAMATFCRCPPESCPGR
jgi:hypothetical protein